MTINTNHKILFETVYIPAFIKASNYRGRYFKDLQDLGQELLKTAQARQPGVKLASADMDTIIEILLSTRE
jgi:hypothetical protein